MSGKCFSSGKLTNKGAKDLYIWPYLNLKIDSISLHIIPIALDSFGVDLAKRSEDFLKCFYILRYYQQLVILQFNSIWKIKIYF